MGEDVLALLPLRPEELEARARRASSAAAGSPRAGGPGGERGSSSFGGGAGALLAILSPTRAASALAGPRGRETHERRLVRLRYAPLSRQLWLEADASLELSGPEPAVRREIKLADVSLLEYGLGQEHCADRPGLVFTLVVGAAPYIVACSSATQLARVFCGLQALSGRQVGFGELARRRLLGAIDRRCAAQRLGPRARHLAVAVRRAARLPRSAAVERAHASEAAYLPPTSPPKARSRSASPGRVDVVDVSRALRCLTP